jgi:hypothetical protein
MNNIKFLPDLINLFLFILYSINYNIPTL